MDKNWKIKQIIRNHVGPGEGEYTDYKYEIGIIQAAAHIAALFEREMEERDEKIKMLEAEITAVRILSAGYIKPLEKKA